jgi:hypothetical protein
MVIGCTSGSPHFQASESNQGSVSIKNAESNNVVKLRATVPGLSSINSINLINNSDGTATINMDTLSMNIAEAIIPMTADPELSLTSEPPWGGTAVTCKDVKLAPGESCSIFIKYTAPPIPSYDFKTTAFSVTYSIQFPNNTSKNENLTAQLLHHASEFADGGDGSIELTDGTINPLLLTIPWDETKLLFAYDEIKSVTPTIGTLGESESQLITYNAKAFSFGDEVLLYVSSAHHNSNCAQANLVGAYQFARVTKVDKIKSIINVEPPLDPAWTPVAIDNEVNILYQAIDSSNPFCNIQVIRVPHLYNFKMTNATLLVPQYLTQLGKQSNESRILGNLINRTGGLLPFRVYSTFTMVNSAINAVGSGFNGGRRYGQSSFNSYHDTPYGLGNGIFGWTSIWMDIGANIFDIKFPTFHSGGDAAHNGSAGSHMGQGGFVKSDDHFIYGNPSVSLPYLFSKPVTEFGITKAQRIYLGSGGGYSNAPEFYFANTDGTFDGGGFAGGGIVIGFANEIDSTAGTIVASGDKNTIADEIETYLYAEFLKPSPTPLAISIPEVEALLQSSATIGTYSLTTGTAIFKPRSNLIAQEFKIDTSKNNRIISTGTSLILKIFINTGTFYFDFAQTQIESLSVNGDSVLSGAQISASNFTMNLGNHTLKHWRHRGSGSGGSIWLTTTKFIKSDLFLNAEGGGSNISRVQISDNLDDLLENGGGGGNIHLSTCGTSSAGIPKISTAGGRSDKTRENISSTKFIYNQGNNDELESSWGSGGLTTYQFGHEECSDQTERLVYTKEIELYAMTYREIEPTAGTLMQEKIVAFANMSAGTIFNVGMGCTKGVEQNAYLEFKIPDTSLQTANILNVSLSLPALGQAKWNGKFMSDSSHERMIDRSLIGDSLKIRGLKTLQSAYFADTSPRFNRILDAGGFTQESESPYFTFKYLDWTNERFFDSEFNLELPRLNWPKSARIIEPNLLTLIKTMTADTVNNITEPFQNGASLGFAIGRKPYFVNANGTNIYLSCAQIYAESSSSGPDIVYFEVSASEYPKLIIHYSN